jgi:predicted DNA-binding transcriptional regulator AlpA
MKELINDREVAKITGLSVASVRRLRVRQKGPKYYKLGTKVKYRPEDVVSWLEEQPTDDPYWPQGGGLEEAEKRSIGSPFNRFLLDDDEDDDDDEDEDEDEDEPD